MNLVNLVNHVLFFAYTRTCIQKKVKSGSHHSQGSHRQFSMVNVVPPLWFRMTPQMADLSQRIEGKGESVNETRTGMNQEILREDHQTLLISVVLNAI